jgi:hypothetical protein
VFGLHWVEEVIELRLSSPLEYNGFTEASVNTKLLSDDSLVVHIGGDRGGVMPFKVGVIIMNCATLNTPENFDFISAFYAKDSYYNLKEAIFHDIQDELDALCAD